MGYQPPDDLLVLVFRLRGGLLISPAPYGPVQSCLRKSIDGIHRCPMRQQPFERGQARVLGGPVQGRLITLIALVHLSALRQEVVEHFVLPCSCCVVQGRRPIIRRACIHMQVSMRLEQCLKMGNITLLGCFQKSG